MSYLKPIGALFMRLIKMVITPGVFFASRWNRKPGRCSQIGSSRGENAYSMRTTAMAVTIGLLCAHIVNPGSFISENDQAALVAQFEAVADSKATQRRRHRRPWRTSSHRPPKPG